MSASEEDTELKELVIQALENNGVLAKIRAQLRASVFLALDEANSLQKNKPLVNKELQDYLSTKNGKYVAYLVHNFLKHFKLDSTLSVFEPESYHGQLYGSDEQQTISDDLGIRQEDDQAPLLDCLLRKCATTISRPETDEPSGFLVHQKVTVSPEVRHSTLADVTTIITEDRNSERSVGEGQEAPKQGFTNSNADDDDDDDDDDFFGDPPALSEHSNEQFQSRPLLDNSLSAAASVTRKAEWDAATPLSPVRPTDFGSRPLKPLNDGPGRTLSTTFTSDPKADLSPYAGSVLGSLRGAPPLNDVKAKLPPLNLWKDNASTTVNQGLKSASADDYEEDFLSSASIRSDQKTGTELSIEEDIEDENQSLHIDDLLSNGAASESEDATTDHTVSHVSTTGIDYLESIG